MSRAAQVNDQAAHWLARREDGPWGEAEQTEFEAWLARSDGNKAAYWRLKHSWREADRAGALGAGASVRTAPGRRWWLPTAIAASIAALVAFGLGALRPEAAAVVATDYATPLGGRRSVALSDGSRVELNTASRLRASIGERREVWLDQGEAYFEVTHLNDRPFIVHAGSRQVTVLGTRFSVRRDGDRITVSVAEGRVRVDDVADARAVRSATINAGGVAIAQGRSTLVTDRSRDRVERALAWRDGMLNFDQSRLADIAAEFNRYNRRRLVVEEGGAGEMRIGGMFPANDPEAFSRLLRDAYGLEVRQTSEAIRISS